MTPFDVRNGSFVWQERPVTIISGAMHYFRIVPEYWEDRLLRLKAAGFNCVETYIPWNLHEPAPGQYDFTGMADVEAYIEIAARLELWVIVRPSPYICAEWEFGGLPSWLLADPAMRVRCSYPGYLQAVDRYYDELIPRLLPYLCTKGGPVLAVQVENEYGSYGNDTAYLEHIRDALIGRGVDVLLFTSDGPEHELLTASHVDGALMTVNFGSQPEQAFHKLRQHQPGQPVMCMEYWNGWFDHWGEEHHVRDAGNVGDELLRMLQDGASVNFYMFHGGTNFGFYNGANHIQTYEPTITSYDYNALLSESGQFTEKYHIVRDVLHTYRGLTPPPLPEPIKSYGYGELELTESVGLFSVLDILCPDPVYSPYPLTMEELGQSYGFVLYTTTVSGPLPNTELHIQHVRDRAQVYIDGRYAGVIDRSDPDAQSLQLDIDAQGARLSILVENMGRINYGPHLLDRKGITEGVRLGNQFLHEWVIYSLDGKLPEGAEYTSISSPNTLGVMLEAEGEKPAFYRTTFEVSQRRDTFVDMKGWQKGIVYINGFNLGRYWNKGPQRTLYIPAPLLVEGTNELIILELHGSHRHRVMLTDEPLLG
ncbi:beta-galactosidase [Paenibacillus sp. WLX1005]|uniref:glycoside hydrolase family 35 protein n=1 Tax=Paenibacillus sp. WLX1005 TaxID=3243766 RepID=UPI0039843C73